GAGEGRHDQNPRLRAHGAYGPGRGDAVHARHLAVHQGDIGVGGQHHLHGHFPGSRDPDHGQVALQLQQRCQCTAQHGLIIHDHQADGLGIRHQVTATRVPPGSSAATSREAPPVVARSRIPRTPFPSPPANPRPSSVTVKLPGAMATVTARAPAWRSTFVVASRRIQLAVSDCAGESAVGSPSTRRAMSADRRAVRHDSSCSMSAALRTPATVARTPEMASAVSASMSASSALARSGSLSMSRRTSCAFRLTTVSECPTRSCTSRATASRPSLVASSSPRLSASAERTMSVVETVLTTASITTIARTVRYAAPLGVRNTTAAVTAMLAAMVDQCAVRVSPYDANDMMNGTKLSAEPPVAGMVSPAHTMSAANTAHWIGFGGATSPPPPKLMPWTNPAT